MLFDPNGEPKGCETADDRQQTAADCVLTLCMLSFTPSWFP